MAGMARAMGATLIGAQQLFGKNQNLRLAVSSTSVLLHIQPLTAQLHQCSALNFVLIPVCCTSTKVCDKIVAL